MKQRKRAGRLMRWFGLVLWCGMTLALPAQAQKARDTVRVGLYEPIASILLYDDPQPQNALITRAVFDTLLCYQPSDGNFAPSLARAWRQPDATTLEFDLRDDVRFHDGAPVGPHDVAYTLNWLIDPASPYRFKENFSWVKGASVVGSSTVRIAMNEPNPVALTRLATSLFILPRHLHAAQADKSAFGRRTPVGSGPYRVESVDAVKAVVLVRNVDYPHATPCKPAAAIGRIEALPMPDVQTQAAQLMTGGLDVMRVSTKETSEMFERDPRLAITSIDGMMLQYVAFDSVNRSGNAALSDVRVRRAVAMSIDRVTVAASVTPGLKPPPPADALCFPVQRGCAWTLAPSPPDRTAAKALLAQAGFPQGFDVEITAFASAAQLAEAVAGEFHKIGVRAKVDRVTLAAYRQKQRDGRLQVLVGLWTSGGLPDASSTVDLFFAKGPRDYWRDETIQSLAARAMQAGDENLRKRLYADINDRVNANAYILPIAGRPEVFAHVRELNPGPGTLNGYGIEANEFRWR